MSASNEQVVIVLKEKEIVAVDTVTMNLKCANEKQCQSQLDLSSVETHHVDCNADHVVNVTIEPGLFFKKGLFAFKNTEPIELWTLDEYSCNLVDCAQLGIDAVVAFDLAPNGANRAVNETVAVCLSNDGKFAKVSCINGKWHGVINHAKPKCN